MENDTQFLRQQILSLTEQFFRAQQAEANPFVPGKTYIPVTTKFLSAEDAVALVDSSLDLWLTAGRFTKAFEQQLADVFHSKVPSVFVNSGSSANLIALASAWEKEKRQSKREVITLAAGFPTTVNPIVQLGLIPVFIDIDLNTLNALPETIESAVTPKTCGVFIAHTLGNPFRSDLVAEMCKRRNLFLIEDCCDALGATISGKPVGSFGEYATASFYPAHHITTGEGGAVIAKDAERRKLAESFRDWGRDCWCATGKDNTCGKRFDWKLGDLPQGYDHKYIYSVLGYNLKATDMQAAIGVSQLKKLSEFTKYRRENWYKLAEGIKASPLLSENLQVVQPTPGTEPSWFGMPLFAGPRILRAELTRYLENNRVGTRLLFAGNITKQPSFQGVEYRKVGALESTDRVMEKLFWIGTHPKLTSIEIDYMLQSLEDGIRVQVGRR